MDLSQSLNWQEFGNKRESGGIIDDGNGKTEMAGDQKSIKSLDGDA